MKKGDTVTIHVDPVTKETKEGDAKLIKKIDGPNLDGLECWQVRFLDDDPKQIVTRWI